jgi:hypothetical protein
MIVSIPSHFANRLCVSEIASKIMANSWHIVNSNDKLWLFFKGPNEFKWESFIPQVITVWFCSISPICDVCSINIVPRDDLELAWVTVHSQKF